MCLIVQSPVTVYTTLRGHPNLVGVSIGTLEDLNNIPIGGVTIRQVKAKP